MAYLDLLKSAICCGRDGSSSRAGIENFGAKDVKESAASPLCGPQDTAAALRSVPHETTPLLQRMPQDAAATTAAPAAVASAAAAAAAPAAAAAVDQPQDAPAALADGTKGKGKGKAKGPKGKAPPPSSGAPKAKAKVIPASQRAGSAGMSELLLKSEGKSEQMDREYGQEMKDIDMSKVNPNAKEETKACPRCEKQIRLSQFDSHWNAHSSEILPWLFLGGKQSGNNAKELTVRTGITHILNVAHEVCQDHEARDDWEAYNKEQSLPCEYKKVSWYDRPDQDIIQEMQPLVDFIHAAHKASPSNRVLVHCVQGISRSSSVVIFYLMQHEGKSLREAFEHTKSRRVLTEPRREFLDQLGAFECRSRGLEKPTLTGEEVFKDRVMLNVD